MKKILVLFCLAAILFAGKLGDGYQEAKWGMSKEQVKALLLNGNRRFHYESENLLIFDMENKQRELRCYFYNDKFYYAEYTPFDARYVKPKPTKAEADAVLIGLKNKYGEGKSLPYVSSIWGRMIRMVWDDGITEIEFSMPDPNTEHYKREAIIYGDKAYPSTSIKIFYKSKKLIEQKEAEKLRLENEKKNKTLKSLEL